MEEVLEKMESAMGFQPKHEKNEFESLYKNWGRYNRQEKRRQEKLEIQKSDRRNKLDLFRGILNLVNAAEHNDIFHNKKKVHYRPNIYVAGFNKVSTSYNNILMMSEWMIEKPSDFAENWYVTPCPKGTRMLVVAYHGTTKCYTKFGQFKFEMHSALPGGNLQDGRDKNNLKTCCVLDCFYNEKIDTMYVLDFLAWNNQPMTDCDTEFRNFWLQSQFAENPDLDVVSMKNKIRFVLLPKTQCTAEDLNKFMMTCPHFENDTPEADGLLFYHKQAHYVSGETPLVVWLYPYMVHELLGEDVTVHEKYIAQKPADYVNQADFINRFEENLKKKLKKTQKRPISENNNAMDTVAADETKTEMEAEDIPEQQSPEVDETKSTDMEAEESLKVADITKDIKTESEVDETKSTDMEAEESLKVADITKDIKTDSEVDKTKSTGMEADESLKVDITKDIETGSELNVKLNP